MNSSAEEQWVRAAQDGDIEAFERLYRRHVSAVYGTCRRLLERKDEAEDLTHRVFVRAWQRLGSYRGSGPFGAWLRRIAVHQMLDERRSRWRRDVEQPLDSAAEIETMPLRSSDSAVDLERAIRCLPPGARRVLLLHDVEGLTHQEIAQLLGVSVGTSKTQLHRARRSLQEVLR